MIRRPPRSTRTDTLCPYTRLFRSADEPAMGGIDDRTRHPAGQQRRSLSDDPRLDLAGIMAPRLERAAQRADRPLIDRAMRHVGRLAFGPRSAEGCVG